MNIEGGSHFWTVLQISLIISQSSEYSHFNLCIQEDLENCDFILIRFSCSEISDNDRYTGIPFTVK